MFLKSFAVILAALLGFACSSTSKSNQESDANPSATPSQSTNGESMVVNHENWGKTSVKQFENFYIGAEPEEKTLENFKSEGGAVVIDLRQQGEMKHKSEKIWAKKHGLRYFNIPVASNDIPRENPAVAIADVIRKNKDKKIMIYCKSGQRAAAWLAIHLEESGKMTQDKAIAVGQEAGLTNEKLITKIKGRLPANTPLAN